MPVCNWLADHWGIHPNELLMLTGSVNCPFFDQRHLLPERTEIEKSAQVILPDYVRSYLKETLDDTRLYNQRIQQGEAELLTKITACHLNEQVDLMCTVPYVTKLLALRIIAEMGENYHQRYYSAAAFAKAIGVVPSNEVSGGKLLKRKASHGNKRVKFHLLQTAKVFAMHGKGHLREWYNSYRGRTTYLKAISALARRMAEGLWWVLVRNEPYRYWKGEPARTGSQLIEVGDQLVDPETGEVLETLEPDPLTVEM
jgi:hypothetical protein